MAEDIDKAFHDLAVKERDYERAVNARLRKERDYERAVNAHLRAELIRAKVRLGELGVGAFLSVDAQVKS